MDSIDPIPDPPNYGPVLLIQGRYQVVGVESDRLESSGGYARYAVLTTAGGFVRQELTLDAARQWALSLDSEEQAIATPELASTARAASPVALARSRQRRR